MHTQTAKKALARAKVESEGKIALLEAAHQKALSEASEEASAAGSANEKRLTALCASQLQSLHAADEASKAMHEQVQKAHAEKAAAHALVTKHATATEVVTNEVVYLEAQVRSQHLAIERDVAEYRRVASIEKQAAAAAEGRAAAAEQEVLSLRQKALRAEERHAAAARAAEAALAAAKEAHGAGMGEAREAHARDRERHAELVEALRMELAQTRDQHTAALARAEDTRIRLNLRQNHRRPRHRPRGRGDLFVV